METAAQPTAQPILRQRRGRRPTTKSNQDCVGPPHLISSPAPYLEYGNRRRRGACAHRGRRVLRGLSIRCSAYIRNFEVKQMNSNFKTVWSDFVMAFKIHNTHQTILVLIFEKQQRNFKKYLRIGVYASFLFSFRSQSVLLRYVGFRCYVVRHASTKTRINLWALLLSGFDIGIAAS